MVNQTLENMQYEIRCYHESAVQYTNCLVCNLHDAIQIFKLYTETLGYAGVQLWQGDTNITESAKSAKVGFVRVPKK
jgi:hypothetical protein